MFILNVDGHDATEAEFEVPSALMALDLALNAVRAGMSWRAAVRAERVQPLSLPMLWRLAEADAAHGSDGAAYFDAIVRAERAGAAARRN